MGTIKTSELQFNQIEEISDEDLTGVVGGCAPTCGVPTVKAPTCGVGSGVNTVLGGVGSGVNTVLSGVGSGANTVLSGVGSGVNAVLGGGSKC